MEIKRFIKDLLPPILLQEARKLKSRKYGWKGNYSSWKEATEMSEGYDKQEIVDKVRTSLLQVKKGAATFERDSVLFYSEEYNWQLLSALFFVAARCEGKLDVLDFGGSLGSSYYQNRNFFDRLNSFHWSVIEQPHFVQIGKEEFASNKLSFFKEVSECLSVRKINCLLLSSVLQYIENPYQLLEELVKYEFPYIVIDRMPFHSKEGDRICIQYVPPEIYNATYPCHLLDANKFLRFFDQNKYTLISGFEAIDGEGEDYHFKGYIFERN